jgi:hypothetical protein
MRKKLGLKVAALACATAAVFAATASAITFGEPDGTRHPNVGALVADWNPDSGPVALQRPGVGLAGFRPQ